MAGSVSAGTKVIYYRETWQLPFRSDTAEKKLEPEASRRKDPQTTASQGPTHNMHQTFVTSCRMSMEAEKFVARSNRWTGLSISPFGPQIIDCARNDKDKPQANNAGSRWH